MLTGTKIAIRATSLDLCDILLAQTKLFVETEDVLPDGDRSHSIRVMRNATESGGRLARRERLPPRVCPAPTSVD